MDRFAPVLASIEYQLARSLPVIDDAGKEVVFFYKVRELDERQYSILEIRYILFRDANSGKIEMKSAFEALPEALIKEVLSSVCKHTMDVETELAAEDEYLTGYEEAFESHMKSGSIDVEITDRLSTAFQKLLDGTCLEPVYMHLASGFVRSLLQAAV